MRLADTAEEGVINTLPWKTDSRTSRTSWDQLGRDSALVPAEVSQRLSLSVRSPQVRQYIFEFPWIDRLDHVSIESRRRRALAVGFLSVSRHGNQADMLRLWILTQTPCNLVPVDLW